MMLDMSATIYRGHVMIKLTAHPVELEWLAKLVVSVGRVTSTERLQTTLLNSASVAGLVKRRLRIGHGASPASEPHIQRLGRTARCVLAQIVGSTVRRPRAWIVAPAISQTLPGQIASGVVLASTRLEYRSALTVTLERYPRRIVAAVKVVRAVQQTQTTAASAKRAHLTVRWG